MELPDIPVVCTRYMFCPKWLPEKHIFTCIVYSTRTITIINTILHGAEQKRMKARRVCSRNYLLPPAFAASSQAKLWHAMDDVHFAKCLVMAYHVKMRWYIL